MIIDSANRLNQTAEYYFSRKLKEVRALAAQGKPIINMGIGSPDLPPPPHVIEALTNSLVDGPAHQYQSYKGLPELTAAMSTFYENQYGVKLDAESEILPLMGSKEGIMHISMAFLNPGDEVLIPNPGYPTYTSVTRLVEAEPVYYNLDASNNWMPDYDALAQRDLSKVKLMWVNYPHMPTGAKATKADFENLIAFAKANQILLVNDNPYSFILNENPQSILAVEGAKDVAIELNSLSKSFNMSGWRVGMLLGASDYINTVLTVKSNMDSGMFYGIQKGAAAVLKEGKEWFDSLNTVYQKRRELAWQLADLLNCEYSKDTAGMFVWAKLPEGAGDAEAFIDDILINKSIFITPGSIFGSQGAGYIRFSLCVTEDKIKEAISRLKN
ncbi:MULTISPECIES: aminotransferase class I/II-fold pyridoxal phosphate-dependent enzyme [unclassified Leeuwenhoekiella]|uniref:pyridoxal phosphate-dependent aminotransferase n=1 Tax=unclassified Leeuwenhoekiella TaxID=2615029 RepID=UPI000C67E13D|nr:MULTISPECIES: aminotransferase class I/II-fold pyridoxal phosphate-dependent enzyme [unclassified Leeuwenhoekiella]MAW96467.1 aminotransferase [Leeuwenhoekiella sp.]MBA81354.1 aminotransferase [Leeuwenhoekiella sp.]|tara:strand:+ start:28947 stop:30101 length:1155 start_codon:yes stop_codon:yes gene_type:complete